MLASCVYHLLYYNGDVLGASGIYASSLSKVLSLVRSGFSRAPPPSVTAVAGASTNPTSTETDSLIDNSSNPKIDSSADEGSNTSEADNDNWKLAFTAGLLCAGILLRVLRPVLERHLGVPIFDKAVIEGTSSTPLLTFLVGSLVGIGTKVISSI